jgi:undecaprenyl-diphosphatase
MKKSYLLGIIISFILFIATTIIVKICDLSFEKNIFDFLQKLSIRGIMILITTFGEWFVFVFFTLICLLTFNKKTNIAIITNLLLATALNNILKVTIMRDRPIWKTIDLQTYSFPSGHTMISFIFYGLLIYLINKNYHGKYKKLIISLLSILIFLVGLSRIFLGVHYFTDVIGAYFFGTGYLLLFIYIAKRRKYV